MSYITEKTKRWLQYGFLISFIDESYLFLLVCAGLNVGNYFEWSEGGSAFNSVLALFCALAVVIFPVYVALFYSHIKNYDQIKKRDPDF